MSDMTDDRTTELTRRTFLAGAGALALSATIPSAVGQTAPEPLGHWLEDDYGLPSYQYTGPLRFPDSPMRDGAAMLPDDPLFLIGNYKLTLFTHASGIYQLLSGERSWARLNCGSTQFDGMNHAVVEIAGQATNLIGLDSPAALAASKCFGVGFAQYEYSLPSGIEVSRTLSVKPSTNTREGTSAFLLQVVLRNTSATSIDVRYTETTRASYKAFSNFHDYTSEVDYANESPTRIGADTIVAAVRVLPKKPLVFPPAGQITRLEQYPPALFIRSLSPNALPYSTGVAPAEINIGVQSSGTLKPGEQRLVEFVVGYTRDPHPTAIANLASQLKPTATKQLALGSAFGNEWSRIVPAFATEKDPILRREMRWNVAVIEAMATWREYYDETVIPQGTMYDYRWGVMASSRDIAQQALPLCHTNPALAKSTLRWIMKRMVADGEIKLNDEAFGWADSGPTVTSDQQLYFFLLMAEYLRATRDTSILTEEFEFYPRDSGVRGTGLDHLRRAFLFLRDRVSVGYHGIVRRWNSDWNDMFFWWPTVGPYNLMWLQGESHMNSTMAVTILGNLAAGIDADPTAKELAAALRTYRTQLYDAWLKDLGDRAFSLRAWTDPGTPLGDQDMWLEPQSYALMIPELSVERKRRLYSELQNRLLAGETMGARQIEKPSAQTGTPAGTRENGGFWYALHGPLVLGVATFDPTAAEELLRRMTFANFAQHYPRYWTGQWSASDSLDSSRTATAGLSMAMPYCAHAHAWPLYCYLRLRQNSTPTQA